ncbi:MAG: 50S ribosomal protein L6 [Firmicutes bacterium]|nr:50S ribosomal protein L6 [Bacillota bacterium]
MSRIGREEIVLEPNVEISVSNKNLVTIKGPLGELRQQVDPEIKVEVDGKRVRLTRLTETKEAKAAHGLYRSLLNNMAVGVTKGFSKSLVINGVGYKVAQQGNDIVLNVGLSHQVVVKAKPGIKLSCPTALEIKVTGANKQEVGQMAAEIRAVKKVEPYHLYGIRYSDEVVVKKQGKTTGKK